MTISTITIGATDYVAYASVAEADAYLAVDPTRATAWAALTDDQKGANLVAATRRLDLLKWEGAKASASQANEWPRTGVTDKAGEAVASDEVPQALEDATILLAGSIALDGTQAEQGSSGSNVKSVKAGSAQVSFFRPTIPGKPLKDETAFALIQQFLGDDVALSSGLFGGASGVSGANSSSSFCDPESPDLNEGYP